VLLIFNSKQESYNGNSPHKLVYCKNGTCQRSDFFHLHEDKPCQHADEASQHANKPHLHENETSQCEDGVCQHEDKLYMTVKRLYLNNSSIDRYEKSKLVLLRIVLTKYSRDRLSGAANCLFRSIPRDADILSK
jgi:hypothetical protein